MIGFNIILNGAVLIAYCLLNAVFLTGIWHMLGVGFSDTRSFKDVFIKTALSICVVYGLTLLVGHMFCWTSLIAHCLACICPVMAGISAESISVGGAIFFLLAMVFMQLTLVVIPVRLSRLLFVLTIMVSNVIVGLLKLGISAALVRVF